MENTDKITRILSKELYDYCNSVSDDFKVTRIEELVALGADPNYFFGSKNKKTTALACAVAKRNVEAVDSLLKNGANPNIKNNEPEPSYPALHVACKYNAHDIFLELHTDDNGSKRLAIIDLLIKNGADIYAEECYGLHWFAVNNLRVDNEKEIDFFISKNFDFNRKNSVGKSALDIFQEYGSDVADYIEKRRLSLSCEKDADIITSAIKIKRSNGL